MSYVFVYGTLKRGGSNHRYLQGQTFIAPATTVPGYRLYRLDGYPGMVPDPAHSHGVHGEIWEVDAAGLAALDELEGVAENLYRRAPVPLAAPYQAIHVETYLYAQSICGRAELGPHWPV